jgi:hypothetical protein
METLDRNTPERLADETARAYQAFCYYRDLGPGRSFDKAYQRYCADRGMNRSSRRRPGGWSNWSTKYNWVERAKAYDGLKEDEKDEADAERLQKIEDKNSQFAVEEQERRHNLIRSCDEFLQRALKAPFMEVTIVKDDKGAVKNTITNSRPPNWKDVSTGGALRNKTVELSIQGSGSKGLDKEERIIDRIVWRKAPTELDKAA